MELHEAFALPSTVNVSTTSDFMVYVGGVFQSPSAYTYPSVTLAYQGIDIGDNSAVNLLTNFASNLTDSSPKTHTVTMSSGSATYSASNLVLDGTNFIKAPSSTDLQ